MKYQEILNIKKALEEIGKERLPVAYEIARNIRLCNKIIDDTASLSKELFEKFADKDEAGKLVETLDSDGKGSFKITNPSDVIQYQTEMTKLLNEEHQIEFIKIPNKVLHEEKISALFVLPLLDVIVE